MAFGNYDVATESAFDPEVTTASLLDAIRANVNSNINTIEAAVAVENELSEQAVQFNQMLMTIENAIHKCESGEISPDEAKAEVAPCVKALKTNCKALNLANVNVGSDDIDESEIAMLREVIVKSKDIVSARRKDIEDCPITANASEGVMSMLSDMSYASESATSDQLKKSTEKKTADTLYKNAKKLYSLGNKEKAVEYMTKAKQLYEKLIAQVKKLHKAHDVERTIVNGKRGKDVFTSKTISDKGAGSFCDYLEDRVDSCQAWLLKWKSNSEKADYKALKAQLKSERKAQSKQNFDNWKTNVKSIPEKIASIPDHIRAKFQKDPEAAVQEGLMYIGFVDACESFMDNCEMELALEAAMEGEGSGEGEGKAGLGARIRAAFARLKKAKAADDTKELNSANAEVQSVCKEVENADDGSEEKKKGLSTIAKIGLAAAATAAVAAGLTVAGQRAMKAANGDINNIQGAMRNVAQFSNAIVNAPKAIAQTHAANVQYNKAVKAAKDKEREHLKSDKQGTKIDPWDDKDTRDWKRKERVRNRNLSNERIDRAKTEQKGIRKANVQDIWSNAANATNEFARKKPGTESFTIANLVDTLAYESDLDSLSDESVYANDEGKSFDESTMFGSQMIEDATESDENLDDLATESAILAYATEDGFEDDC